MPSYGLGLWLSGEWICGKEPARAKESVVAGAHTNANAHEHRLQRARDDDDQEDQCRDPVGCQHRQACHRHCRCRNCAWYVGCVFVFFSLSRPQTCTHALQNTHVVCTVFTLWCWYLGSTIRGQVRLSSCAQGRRSRCLLALCSAMPCAAQRVNISVAAAAHTMHPYTHARVHAYA